MEEEQHLPRPHKRIFTRWESHEIREALEKSRADVLNNLTSTSTSTSQPFGLLINLATVENLFLVDTTHNQEGKMNGIGYVSYGAEAVERGGWEWGSRDIMFDLRDATDQFSRMDILTAAANLTDGAVRLLQLHLTEAEERALVEALALAADRDAGPSSLLIEAPYFKDVPALLSALKKNKRLKHLSFHWMNMSDECIQVLADFASLTSLHLQWMRVSAEFVGELADLHPSHSPLVASLHRLHIQSFYPIDWRRSTGFLRHWPQLKELSLIYTRYRKENMKEEELMDFMDHLAPPKKEEAETAGSSSTLPSSPPQLYSLQLGEFQGHELSRSATAAVVDALSRSGLPFFDIQNFGKSRKNQPVIEAQLKRNQRNFLLGKDSTRVAATSMRLFICGDPFAGTQNTHTHTLSLSLSLKH